MWEIIWHGRGGQGAFTAARLLGAAYTADGDDNYSLAFPSFGPERRGAPVRAFTKLSGKRIGDRSEVSKADYSVYLDDTLFDESSLSELKDGGIAIVNTKKSFDDKRIIAIDAESVAMKHLGVPITNTVMLGAFIKVFGGLSYESVERAIETAMPEKLWAGNIAAVHAAGSEIIK